MSGTCGNWGECPCAVYAVCGSGTYVEVWSAGYAVGLTAGPSSCDAGGPWTELQLISRRVTGALNSWGVRRLGFDRGQKADLPVDDLHIGN